MADVVSHASSPPLAPRALRPAPCDPRPWAAGFGAPLALSENARQVLESRYLARDDRRHLVETPEEMFRRVARAVAAPERAYGADEAEVEATAARFYGLMASGVFLPNSPTLMNAGREMGMLSACFVLPVGDSIDEIFTAVRQTALIQKAGGGTGFDFSRLRPKGDLVRTSGGTTSGPLSFLRVFSRATDAIQQGAFRRGANMGMLRVDHPDIVEFISLKEKPDELLNYNLSVSAPSDFVKRLREDPSQPHFVTNPRTGQSVPLEKAGGGRWTVGEVYDLIIDRAWKSGEPGLVFIDRINDHNPTPHVGRMEGVNPCGEQPLLPYESCNLGSINVGAFASPGGAFDWAGLREAARLGVRFLDDVIDANRYPLPETAQVCRANRKIGLGVMGFADALFALGLRYDSDAAVAFGERLMKFVNDEAHAASEELAAERGVFPNWRGSLWEERGRRVRNACVTTVAPTGTISIIAGCSGGIEPLFSLAFFRNVLDGKRLAEVHRGFRAEAERRGIFSADLIERIAAEGSVRHLPGVPDDLREVYASAHDVAPEWHVRMQAAFQRHCDASVSKTINFPASASRADVRAAYDLAWDLGCKGITVYRDGCRIGQPMALSAGGGKAEEARPSLPATTAAPAAAPASLRPVDTPDVMPCIRVRQRTPFGNMHVKITVEPKSEREREVFAQLGRGGDVASSDLEAVCRMISLWLRCNGSLDDVVKQLSGIGSVLNIPTKDGPVMSLADALAKALRKYLAVKTRFSLRAMLLGDLPDGALDAISRELKEDRGWTIEPLPRGDTASTVGEGSEGASEWPGSGSPGSSVPSVARPLPGAHAEHKIRCPACDGVLAFESGCVVCHACGFSRC
ncbi:MAG: vitamin B12-dependent ribonucleotide reductase [Planctomycetes bacterium]|nr:vitamin B12-dependent ribonucleotide reductase [Planctomycetota bacterium]